jgi:uncharacterized protein (DUF362 family)
MATAKAGSRRLPRITRRRFLQLLGGGLAWLAAGSRPASATTYRVGVGKLADPYAATRRAVEACGEWPAGAIANQKVTIKPNLVVPMTAETGVTTDPQVVRALVDMALEAGAAQVVIVESEPQGANFSACGYDFFSEYDPDGRVALIDLNDEPVVLTEVPGGGMAYTELYMPELLLADDVVYISAAKLKCHRHTHATLAMKNLMGLPPAERYSVPSENWREDWRLAMHYRGLSQAIVDLNLVRPIDFAVVDGVIGMEGDGPLEGMPVELDMVVAGRNAVAVDRVCLWATALPPLGVQHLTYAARKGMGPTYMRDIRVVGAPLTLHRFEWPTDLPPIIEYPRAVPYVFAPGIGQQTSIAYWVNLPCQTRVEIVRTSEISPEVTLIRTLHDWVDRPAGGETLMWDGHDDEGRVVPPSRYTARVQARYSDDGTVAYATGWVWVIGHSVYLPMLSKAAE